MALNNRFSVVDKAIIVSTGNSLVLCGDTTTKSVNTSDMIKISGETTRDWNEAESKGKINILSNSTVLYAELIWYSTVKSSSDGALDVRSIQDNTIVFTTPKGEVSVNPQNVESFTGDSGSIDRFRSADVTNIVKESLDGWYTVSKVPTSIPPIGLSNTRAGWTLVVVYRNDVIVPQRIMFLSGIASAKENNPLQTTIVGFSTAPEERHLKGRLFIACANGEPLTGVQTVKAGPTFASLKTLGNIVSTPNLNPGTSPNNPNNGFFAGQINICDPLDTNVGLIDISGTNGSNNHDAFVPTQVLGARNKWDITNVDLSSTLVVNQNQIVGQVTASGTNDGVQLVAVGMQVEAEAPNIIATLTSYDTDDDNEYNVQVGEQLIYSVQVKNKGGLAASNLILSDLLDPCCSFIPNSLKVNEVSQPGADITQGFNAGTIDASGVINILFSVRVNSLPTGAKFKNNVNYNYEFTSGPGSPTYRNFATTNTLEVIVQSGQLSIVKTASKYTAFIGDTLNYTIKIANIGSELARDVLFQDIVSKYCSFNEGSVTINGVTKSGFNPNTGFILPDINVNEEIEIIFEVTVNLLPPSTVVTNNSVVTFSYMFNQYTYLIKKTVISNVTSIQVQYGEIIGERSNDNNYPNVDDIVTYTLNLTNIGNVEVTNFQVLEPPIPGASFVAGSVKINGIVKPLLNPFDGFTVDSILPKQTVTIIYKVKINQIQPGELVENIAQVPFKYQITPGGPVISTEKDSNKVVTRANFVNITINETVDKPYAIIDDILYYSVNMTNSGNIDAFNTLFFAYIQPGTTFVPNSVAINGMPQPSYDTNVGFSIGRISPNSTINVTFAAKVVSVPNPNIVYNTSELIYDYLPDPNKTHITNTVTSNTVQTIINKAEFSITKSVDKLYAQLGDTIIYQTLISNTGTVPLTSVSFVDEVASYLTFYPESVYVNGVNHTDYNPNNSFLLGDIQPSETFRVVFAATITTVPPVGFILNASEMSYSYKVNPDSTTITGTKYSNQVQTEVLLGNLSVAKSASKSYATIGDTITYSINVTNTGNTTANNTVFSDIVPSAVSFVEGSVTVNGISKPSYNPSTGFSLGSVVVGQVVRIKFDVTVNSVPTPNVVTNNGLASFDYTPDPTKPPVTKTITSNNATTVINMGSANLTKSVDRLYATIEDTITYTVVAQNTGTTTLTNINFIDIIPTGATFDIGSVSIDDVSKPDFNPNLGFVLNDIAAGGSSIVKFTAKITSIPNPNTITNTANISFKYRINPSGTDISETKTSNSVTTTINNMDVTNTKSVDLVYATIGDTLNYTCVIANSGNVNLTNTTFTDFISNDTEFVAGSVKVNGESYADYDPNLGFSLGTINTNTNVTVTFKVAVKSLPPNGFVTNQSSIAYNYKIDPNGATIAKTISSNTVTTYINVGSLTITKTSDRNYARLTDTVKYSFVVTNTGNTILNNVNFQDTIQTESLFNYGSVFVNEVSKPTLNPNTGFSLGNIAIGAFATVSFTVTVNSIPASGKLYNSGSVSYSYYVDPNGLPIVKNATSNTTTVNVNDTIVSATKAVDKDIAKIGDTLNFTVTLKNDGNVPAQRVYFIDLLDNNINFNVNSVYVNNVNKPGFNPNDGFTIDDIPGNGTVSVIKFAATVITRPSDNIVKNFATIEYEYKVGTETINVTDLTTNTTQTYIATGELTVTKSVNKAYSTVGDTLSYTINVRNTGSVNATSISLKDIVPVSTSFKTGTVVLNGVSKPTFNPIDGFSISDLIPNQVDVVSFDIHVDSLPISGKIENTADVTFSYKLTPTDPTDTKTTTSNKATTYINLGELQAIKSVDKQYATIGDDLNYTVTIKNIGNADCSNILFQDIIQSNGTFKNGTVIVNGESKPTFNPNIGFNLDTIQPFSTSGSITTVTFKVSVNSMPNNYMIYNTASVNYEYKIDPANPSKSDEKLSNTVSTQINLGKLTITKAVSKAYATIDDILTYTINVVNEGNVNAININFRDVVPSGTAFIPGSVTINDIEKPGYDPYQSFSLGTIVPGGVSVVKFNAIVTSVPSPSLISNIANLVYSYRIDPNGSDIIVEVSSNVATTQINKGELTITKQVDKEYATKGDILTYTVVLTNTGNVDASNVVFTDGLDLDISFNSGSVVIDSESKPNYDPTVGFNLGSIPTLGHVTVSFKVTVSMTPTKSSVLNFANGTFSYKIDPNGEFLIKTTQSNSVLTRIIIGSMTASKTVDLQYATILDTLNYTITIKNTGNTTNKQLTFIDTLSNGASFIAGSVIVDGVSKPDYDPIQGFTLIDILAGVTSEIKFKAKVTSLPTPPQVTNYGFVSGVYKIDPLGSDVPISATSNTVSTQINVGSLSNAKTVDKMYAKVGDTVIYTSVIKNIGNVTATNVKFYDDLQQELMYVGGTVRINDVVNPLANPTLGIMLGDLAPNQTVTITFDAKINSLPTPPQVDNKSQVEFSYKIDPSGSIITSTLLSNTVTTQVVKGELTTTKSVDKPIATIGDTLTFTINLINTGNVVANDVMFQDTPSIGATFKPGTVYVNGVNEPLFDPTVGFTLGNIGIGNAVTVAFTADVVSVPPTNKVTNQAVISFKFVVDPKQPPVNQTTYSNTTTTNIALGSLNVTKAVDKQFATIGQQLTYTVTITNTGNIDATNIVFLDPTPQNSIFVLGSVTVNGVSEPTYNPASGFALNTMKQGEIIVVVYKVQVIS
ncbi:DUF7507 domain-containing protein [Clostridium frigidicarnis]|uniref:Conserved repeat domain-containing protein n=1 Tax=Clostridium frigidicarnis TaxID=84698 RepID=A0A1I0X702_9CLOT|nr:DUF11 domain-containing protein [Clostridium frigidicarnis]SFA96785.1 conserved repeat domain-containing protein [Clostridium frigidicarnis]